MEWRHSPSILLPTKTIPSRALDRFRHCASGIRLTGFGVFSFFSRISIRAELIFHFKRLRLWQRRHLVGRDRGPGVNRISINSPFESENHSPRSRAAFIGFWQLAWRAACDFFFLLERLNRTEESEIDDQKISTGSFSLECTGGPELVSWRANVARCQFWVSVKIN